MCAKTQKIDNVCSPSKRDFLSWQMSGFQLDKCKEESNFLIQVFILAHQKVQKTIHRVYGCSLKAKKINSIIILTIFFLSDYTTTPVSSRLLRIKFHIIVNWLYQLQQAPLHMDISLAGNRSCLNKQLWLNR